MDHGMDALGTSICHWQLTACCPKAPPVQHCPSWLAADSAARAEAGCGMDRLQSTVLGASRGSQTLSVPLDLPGQEAAVVLIPSARVANGYGKHPAGPAGPGCHPQLCLCTSSWGELLEQFRFTAPRTPGRGSVWKNTGRLLQRIQGAGRWAGA